MWFKLCLGENSHLSRTIEENQQIDSVEIVEDEESEPVEGECVDIDLETQKEDLIREFAPSSNLSSINHEVSIQYSVGVVPTTSLMLQFDQVLTQKLIGYHVKWLTIRISRIQELYEFRYRL